MSKILTLTTAALIAVPATALAERGGSPRADSSNHLRQALHQMIDFTADNQRSSRSTVTTFSSHSQGDNPPGQDTRPYDPDQGDDNASDRAISVVCTMDTPAAERSAICRRQPASPY